MRFLTNDEVTAWLGARGLSRAGRAISFKSAEPVRFRVSIEEVASRVVALADYLVPTWPDEQFHGALFLITQRGVWGDFSESTGDTILRLMRTSYPEAGSLEERPGYLFGPNEIFELHAHLVTAMLFGWDAYVVVETKKYLIFVSHDSWVEVIADTQADLQEARSRLSTWSKGEVQHP